MRAGSVSEMMAGLAMALTQPESKERARRLRKAETVAEIKLWEALRGCRHGGLKFVLQLPIGPYVADFACREERLIVEVDGATHSSDGKVVHDERRTAFLESGGYRVVRVWNSDVFGNLDEVCETILQEAGKF